MFLKISQNSQENTCARDSFLMKFFIEEEAQVFSCEICEIFKNAFFHRTPPVAASKIRKTTCGSCGSSLCSLEDIFPQHKSCDCAEQFNAKTSTVYGCTRQPNLKLSSSTFSLLSSLFLFLSLYICTTSSHSSPVFVLMFLFFLSVSLPHLSTPSRHE